MKLKDSTIAKYIEMAKAALAWAISVLASLQVGFSYGNTKIGKTLNVSLLPVLTCGGACRVCLHICYDIRACLQYCDFRRGALACRARNTALAMYDRDRFFLEIQAKMNRRRINKLFRWHVGGDIIDLDYFSRMVELARNNPDWIFWGYTKQYLIVNEYVRTHGGSIAAAIPSNLSIMFSEWKGLDCLNPYGFATFTCVMDGDDVPDDVYYCPGNCEQCIEDGRGCPFQESSAIKQH